MKLLVDTSALIEYLRGNENVKKIIEKADEIYISSLAVFELLSGRVKEDIILDFIKLFKIVPFTRTDGIEASRIYRRLKEKGKLINLVDILIASQAKNRGLTVLTKDKDFEKIDCIKIMLI